MCLSAVHEQYDRPSTFIMDGWKEFHGNDAKPTFANNPLNGSNEVALDQWITANTSQKIRSDDGKSYESGFHVWKDEVKKSSSYRRVFVRSISALGIQDGKAIVIAREMYVPSDPSGWPPKAGEPTKKETMLDKAKKIMKPGNA